MSEELRPASVHDANVFLPGSLGPVRREVVLAYEHDRVVNEIRVELVYLKSVEKERNNLRSELADLKAGQGEAVAVMYEDGEVLSKAQCGDSFDICCRAQTPLYTAPPATADAVSVPVELMRRLTKRVMLRSQEEAHADACEELRALLARQGVKS